MRKLDFDGSPNIELDILIKKKLTNSMSTSINFLCKIYLEFWKKMNFEGSPDIKSKILFKKMHDMFEYKRWTLLYPNKKTPVLTSSCYSGVRTSNVQKLKTDPRCNMWGAFSNRDKGLHPYHISHIVLIFICMCVCVYVYAIVYPRWGLFSFPFASISRRTQRAEWSYHAEPSNPGEMKIASNPTSAADHHESPFSGWLG